MPELEEYDPPLFQSNADDEFNQFNEGGDKEFIDAKSYLLKTSTLSGMNVYDHLASLITKILEERPCNPVDIFEEISKHVKRSRFFLKEDSIVDKVDRTAEYALAKIQKGLFTNKGVAADENEEAEEEEPEVADEDDEGIEEDDEESPLPDLLKLCFYFEQAGIGLNREEMVRIWLAMKSLVAAHSFSKIRFWGKILGLNSNYIVAECQYQDGEESEEEEGEGEEEETEENQPTDKGNDDEDAEDEEEEEMPLPEIKYKKPPAVPREERGMGVNKFTYFVCSEPGKPWKKLPNITPAQISVARKIKKFLTGKLDAPVVSYPPFEGKEAHYLRAQIARISAGTQVSPLGFYHFDEEAQPEEGEIRENAIANEEFAPIPVRDLISPELENWVHHTLHILPQGRVKWWNPKEAGGEGEEEVEEEEHHEEVVVEPEVGPPLLTPLSEDAEIDGMPAWTTRISSKLVPKYAVAVIHSCLWPGAHAFAMDKTFENIYIGWGHKYSPEYYTPEAMPPLQEEYKIEEDIMEVNDPTVAEEEAYKAAHAEPEEKDDEDDEDEEEDDASDNEEED